MKKLLLITSFLASQLFAVQCTEQQYSPIFDENSDRYMHSYYQAADNSHVVIDKKSIIYDKENQKIKCWVIYQQFNSPTNGILKILWEHNLKNNKVKILTGTAYSCEGKTIEEISTRDWYDIIPNSGNEFVLNDLKDYLKIK